MPSENTVHVAIELSFSSWLVAARLPGIQKVRLHRVEGGNTAALLTLSGSYARALRGSWTGLRIWRAALRRVEMGSGCSVRIPVKMISHSGRR